MILEYIVSFFGGDTTLIAQWVKTWSENSFLLIGLSGFSLVTFVVSLVALPVIIAKIPWDYFLETTPGFLQRLALLPRICLLVIKNMAGVLLIAMGGHHALHSGSGAFDHYCRGSAHEFSRKKEAGTAIAQNKKNPPGPELDQKQKGCKGIQIPLM